MPPRIIKDIEEKILHDYTVLKNRTTDIAKVFGLSEATIRSVIKRNGHILRRGGKKYFYNENFFSKIDTEAKAYFLGLLYADGYNSTDSHTISIGLQERDEEILLKFNDVIQSDRPLIFINRKKINPKWQNQKRLYLSGKQISEDLSKLGCYQAKSLILDFPNNGQVPDYLMNHFVRGYLDGDGTIITYIRNDRNIWTTIVSFAVSKPFADKFKEFLKIKLNINSSIIQPKNNKINTLTITGKNQTLSLLDWIYKDASIFLKRKYDRYTESKEKCGLKVYQ